MNQKNHLPSLSKTKELIILIIFWIVYTLFYFIRIKYNKETSIPIILVKENNQLFGITMFFVEMITFSIIYFFILPKLFNFRNWKKTLLLIFFSFLTFILVRYSIEQIITDLLFGIVNYHEKTPLWEYAFENLYYGTSIIFITIFLWSMIHLIKTLQQNIAIEQEKNEAEIKFLKAQINPHFFFFFLNNIYSLVSVNSDKSLKAIENLSAIMRFTTYETNKDKIEIEKEVDYINQYLALEQIRYGNNFYINKNIEIDNNSAQIHPYILSPLIENAIKHGIVKNKETPILINIKSTPTFVEISVENKINQHQKDEISGIGLTNLKRRLNHYFGNNYQFEIKNNYETFYIYLKFPINAEN